MISEPMAHSTQTVHLSCIKITPFSKWIETRLSLEPRHLGVPSGTSKRFLSQWYIWSKPCDEDILHYYPLAKTQQKKRPSGLVVVGRRPCDPLNNHTLLSLGGGSHLKRESHSSPIGLVFYGHWAFLRVGVHKNCWGPGNLNLLGLGQPHLGQMYHLVSESGPCLRGGNDEDILHYYLLAKTQ
jgi:hypothetical protein